MHMRGIHVVGLVALLFGALAFRATEYYTTRYQTLPVVDWLESRPPLAESAAVPSAADLARGLVRTTPLLVIRDDVRPLLPVFGPPAFVQRTIGGVRDAATILLGPPGSFTRDEDPIDARLDVIVFNRALRAAAWSELMAQELDIRDPQSGQPQVRVAGPDDADGVWLVAPARAGGVATVSGHRGVVGFMLQMSYRRPDAARAEDLLDLSARSELGARQVAADWTQWLERQLARAG
jgi:hypothetical protein